MIDPNSEHFKIFQEAHRSLAQQCEAWRKEVAALRAQRVLAEDGTLRVALGEETRTQLVQRFQDRGAGLRRFARSATKSQLLDQLIQDRLDTIDAEIARLERLIADNQPDPRWRERE